MASTYFSVEPSAVHRLGARLTEVADTVAAGATFPPATGAAPYGDLTGALEDFRSDWEDAVARLESLVRGLGGTTTAAGSLLREHDDGLARAWRGLGG